MGSFFLGMCNMLIVLATLITLVIMRIMYLDNLIDSMKYKMIKYGSFLYLKLCTEQQKELVYQKTVEDYAQFINIMQDIDDSSKSITDKVQTDFIPNIKITVRNFFGGQITYENLYTKGSQAKEFIPDE
jgi:hypothetical protein